MDNEDHHVDMTGKQREAVRRKWVQSTQDVTLESFMASVQPTHGCDGAVTVKWCGMWLCIERDGYTHS